jgi:hypothetical protein
VPGLALFVFAACLCAEAAGQNRVQMVGQNLPGMAAGTGVIGIQGDGFRAVAPGFSPSLHGLDRLRQVASNAPITGTGWSDAFGFPGPGLDAQVNCLTFDGAGNLYVGGGFQRAGAVAAVSIAKWDGTRWSALGTGFFQNDQSPGAVYALAADSKGNLYAGGYFTSAGGVPVTSIARWDGTRWSALGNGLAGSYTPSVNTLALDGAGNLYVGGFFTSAGGASAKNIAMWNGSTWLALGPGTDNEVRTISLDGKGNLYAGGHFLHAGDVSANSIAKWDGTRWSALGSRTFGGGINSSVWDPAGSLFVGTQDGGVLKWNNSDWSGLGSLAGADVKALAVDSKGTLYAAGSIYWASDSAGQNLIVVNNIARWTGTTWVGLGTGLTGGHPDRSFPVCGLALDSSGNLYAAGGFLEAGGVTANRVAKWGGSSWSALGSINASANGLNDEVIAAVFDRNGNLYVSGYFTQAGGTRARYIAKWDGTKWSALGSGTDNLVMALAADGTGGVYAGGYFSTAGGVKCSGIARWNGSSWSSVGPGVNGYVGAVTVDDRGNVYAAGSFAQSNGTAAPNVAKWNGSSWVALGSGVTGGAGYLGGVQCLATDASGNLYAAGSFVKAGGLDAKYVAKWDGTNWSALGGGMKYQAYSCVMDSQGYLYVGGSFAASSGNYSVSRWDGASWLGMGSGGYGSTLALAIDNRWNMFAGGTYSPFLAYWNGAGWSALDSGMNDWAEALAVDNRGNVYAGGRFHRAGSNNSSYFARWASGPYPAPAISSVSPVAVSAGASIPNFTVNGSDFTATSTVSFAGSGINVSAYTLRSSNQIVAVLSVSPGATLGKHDVTVGNPDGKSATLASALTVEANCVAPVISADPKSTTIDAGGTVSLQVASTGTEPLQYTWYEGAQGDITRPVGTNSPQFVSQPILNSTRYWVRVRNSCGQADSQAAAITVRVIPVSRNSLFLPGGGSAATSTLGPDGALVAGYATGAIAAGSAPYGTAVFSYAQNGVVVSEVGVPASPPTRSARFFVDTRTNVHAGPGIGTINIFTGFAAVNPNSTTASLSLNLRDGNGTLLAQGLIRLAGLTHIAKFLDQLAPDFVLPAGFISNGLGTLEIAGDQPVSILALRLTINQRGDLLLTSTPIADLSKSAPTGILSFPQIADGGGYQTTLILMNTTGTTESGAVRFYENNGSALPVRMAGSAAAESRFSYSVPPGGILRLVTDGSPSNVAVGWAQLVPDSGMSAPVSAAIFSLTQSSTLVTESGVPSVSGTTHARIYVDTSGGHDTGLAIGNPGNTGARITATAFQTDGATRAGNGPGTVDLAALGHDARFVDQLIAGLPEGFTGVLDLSSSTPFTALTLRSLTNTRGDFLITTFPIADMNQTPPAPIFFPQVANGGGYQTQIIFLSTSNVAAQVDVYYVGDNGSPIAIGRSK